MKTTVLVAAFLALASVQPAVSHDIAWPAGAPRIKGVGHCAKGPCQRRSAFEANVPHRHLGGGKCQGQDAGGYRLGSRFNCRDR
jgi:hypothetical protein